MLLHRETIHQGQKLKARPTPRKNRKFPLEKILPLTSSPSETKKNQSETLRTPPRRAHLFRHCNRLHSRPLNRTITISSEQEASNTESRNSSRDQRQLSPSHQILPIRISLKAQDYSTTATDPEIDIAPKAVVGTGTATYPVGSTAAYPISLDKNKSPPK